MAAIPLPSAASSNAAISRVRRSQRPVSVDNSGAPTAYERAKAVASWPAAVSETCSSELTAGSTPDTTYALVPTAKAPAASR
jgi:hypothetical protein